MPFPHKTVLITGATAGIGRALTQRMVENGVFVIAVGRRKDRLDDLVQKYGPDKLVAEEFDVTDLDAIPSWADKIIKQYPTLSSIILNAGIQRTIDFINPPSSTSSYYTDIALKATSEITTNYTSPLLTITAFLPHLISLGNNSTNNQTTNNTTTAAAATTEITQASIILVTSVLALVPLPRCGNYCATKSALHHLGKSLRYQLTQAGEPTSHIRVIDIIPPAVQTELHQLQPELVAAGNAHIGMPLNHFINEVWEALERWDPAEHEIMVKEVKERFGHVEDGQKAAFTEFMKFIKATQSAPPS